MIDSFMKSECNQRTDEYGGSVENRCRLALEILDAVLEVFDSKRVGVKVSPQIRYNDNSDPDPIGLFTYYLSEVNKRNILYCQSFDFPYSSGNSLHSKLKPLFNGIWIANGGFDLQSAN